MLRVRAPPPWLLIAIVHGQVLEDAVEAYLLAQEEVLRGLQAQNDKTAAELKAAQVRARTGHGLPVRRAFCLQRGCLLPLCSHPCLGRWRERRPWLGGCGRERNAVRGWRPWPVQAKVASLEAEKAKVQAQGCCVVM
jgi:hypothetical protein